MIKRIEQMKISQNLFVIPDDKLCILYEPLEHSALLVNKSAVKALQHFKNGNHHYIKNNKSFMNELIAAGVLVRNDNLENKISFPQQKGECDPPGITLFLTTGCSMRCIYCYSNGGDNPKIMSEKTAKASIKWIIEHISNKGEKELYINFHGGGELVTSFDLFKYCVQYIRKKSKEYGLTTRIDLGLNGVMNTQQVDWIVENTDGATISLDGITDIQNLQRPLIGNKNSFEIVKKTLKRMDKKILITPLDLLLPVKALISL